MMPVISLAALPLTAALVVAQSAGVSITEDEVAAYLDVLFERLKQCDATWLTAQLLASARVHFIYSDGRTETLTPSDYREHVERHCQPWQYVKWDRTSLRVAIAGPTAAVRWKLWWGRQAGSRNGSSSTLVFEEWAQLIREGWQLRIADAGEKISELVPGAEQEYLAPASGPGLLGVAMEWSRTVLDRLRDWRRRAARRQPP
jgi:hypothetical protein